jgi:hypothetical protein
MKPITGLALLALTACGGGGALSPSTGTSTVPLSGSHGTKTFNYTGAEQTFKVPAGVTSVTVTTAGASGGFYASSSSRSRGAGVPGNGGLAEAAIAVRPGEKLAVFVGGQGTTYPSSGTGGFTGGGSGSGSYEAGGGGGASDVRQGGSQLSDRVIVAAGGGGAGYVGYDMGTGGNGGGGGGKRGASGTGGAASDPSGHGGGGATRNKGGIGGAGAVYGAMPQRCRDGCGSCNGHAGGTGSLGLGGNAGVGCGGPGGGGGGGYQGGGGGGSGSYSYYGVSFQFGAGGGGGGGSGFIEKHAMKVQNVQGGAPPGNGQVVITW